MNSRLTTVNNNKVLLKTNTKPYLLNIHFNYELKAYKFSFLIPEGSFPVSFGPMGQTLMML